MRFDYPVLALINTNVINGRKKQVDSVRLILSKVALCWFWKRPFLAGACRTVWVMQAPFPSPLHLRLLLLVQPQALPSLPSLIIKIGGFSPRELPEVRIRVSLSCH